MARYDVGRVLLWATLMFVAAAEIGGREKRCYSCTSYMSQCKAVVDDAHNDVFKETCKGKCFVRVSEDGALYRGCFDGFVEVTQLSHNYNGCQNQTWNGKALPWCMCDSDLCNGNAMDMQKYYNIDAYISVDNGYHDSDVDNSYYNNNEDNNYHDTNAVYVESGPYDDNYAFDNHVGNGVANQDSSYTYDNTASSNQEGSYKYDSAGSANQDDAYMNQFAREGPNDASYDETLFGSNEGNSFPSYPAPYSAPERRTPYPREYKGNYISRNSPDVSTYTSTDSGSHELYYPRPQYTQNDVYGYQAPYGRGPGPKYDVQGYQNQVPQPKEKRGSNYVTSRLAAKIRCSKSGYYQNPNDCRQFIACLMDPYSKTPVMHLMKCPGGLVWDNKKKICMQYSSTCNVAMTTEDKVDVSGYNTNAVDQSYHDDGDISNYSTDVTQDDASNEGNQPTSTDHSQETSKYQNVQDVVFQ